MFNFTPPPSIRDIQKKYDLSPDHIRQEDYDLVSTKFKAISSDTPLVSVVIIAYNEEKNLFKTLMSLAETQCQYPVEFIVANNNSTDRTQEIIDKCGVRSVFETSQGYPHARQAGHNIAKGIYIVSGDADTLYRPKWVEAMVKPFEKSKNVVCTYGLHAFYTEDNKYPFSLKFYQQAKTLGVYFRHIRRPQLNCGGASMAYRANAADEIGGYDTTRKRGTDGYLALSLMPLGKIAMVGDMDALIYTSMRRTDMDGSLGKAFWIRALRYLKNLYVYLTPQREK